MFWKLWTITLMSCIPLVLFCSEASEREVVFDYLLKALPESSQKKNAESIKPVIERLKLSGVCRLTGPDLKIRPAAVGLQCLFEEMFLVNQESFLKGDFEIHTTMPSTPCCKLPSQKAKDTLLAAFGDDARLLTIDGRSLSLDRICNLDHATLHLTYTKAGWKKRSEDERMIFQNYWASRVNRTCIESTIDFPAEINGATYRLTMPSGKEIFFGIQATQAADKDQRAFTLHLGTRSQPLLKRWLTRLERDLEIVFGRTLFAHTCP